MIFDAILKFFCQPIIFAIDSISAIAIDIPVGFTSGFLSLTENLFWAFPIGAFTTIFLYRLAVRVLAASFSIIVRVKSFIPTMGA